MESSANEIVLKKYNSLLHDLPTISNFAGVCSLINTKYSSEKWQIHFENEIRPKDVRFFLHKLSLLKKKKYSRVLNGCNKVLLNDGNYLWAYLVAGAACRNDVKHFHDTPFYFSQALLINPNCLSAWVCLLKYYKEYIYVDNIIFETIFSATLQFERKFEKWCGIVSQLLSSCSGELTHLRDPLKLLNPFLDLPENDKVVFLSQAISEYLLQHRIVRKDVVYLRTGLNAFKIHYIYNPHDEGFVRKVLSHAFCAGNFQVFGYFLEHVFEATDIEECQFETDFFQKITSIVPLISMNSTNDVMQKMIKVYPRKIKCKRKQFRARLTQILSSFNDFASARDFYAQQRSRIRKGHRFSSREILSAIWFNVKLGNLETVYSDLISVTKKITRKLKRRNYHHCKKMVLKKSILHLWLYILTHKTYLEMRKLGVLICLNVLSNEGMSFEILYYACIGFIGLKMEEEATLCLLHLLKLGKICDIIYLKALLENSFRTKIELLKEIPEFVSSHKLTAIASYHSESEVKAFKSICKASVAAPGSVFLYEWLGLFFYEKGDYATAEKYFEVALFYNPRSWTSIEYFPSLLAEHSIEASKIFLDVYRHSERFRYSSLIAFKAGLKYMALKSERMDYFKAAENLMYAYRLSPSKIHYKELIGEAFSQFGMFGVSLKWLEECFLRPKMLNIYAGCQLARQYLFVKGIGKYQKFMRNLIVKGGLDTFISLHNAAHAFLLKSIKVSIMKRHRNKQRLAMVYCQQALFLSVRALLISSNFACTWKLMGDIFYQCGSLNVSYGFLYIPGWLFPEVSNGKITLVRRFRSLLLAIRCYYNGLATSELSEKMKSCLWNSIAVAYKKASSFCSVQGRRNCLLLASNSCLQALKENIKDNLAWNNLGVMLKCLDHHNKDKVFLNSFAALRTSLKLKGTAYNRLTIRANLGFLCLWAGDIESASQFFLDCRGRCTSFDLAWIGQILVILLTNGNIDNIYKHIFFIYKYTRHFPKIRIVFAFLSFLSQYLSEPELFNCGKKYKYCCGVGISTFKDYCHSFLLNEYSKRRDLSMIDLLFAIRTVNGLGNGELAEYNNALYELHSYFPNQRVKFGLLKGIHKYVENVRVVYSLCQNYIDVGDYDMAFLEVLKSSLSEKDRVKQSVLNLALACISFEKGDINSAKYYFRRAQN